jgi:hypothetical protein
LERREEEAGPARGSSSNTCSGRRRTALRPRSFLPPPRPTTNGRAGTHCTDNRDDRRTAYTGDLSKLPGFLLYARTHARTYRYTVVHHYRFAHVHHFRYAHVDESTPIAPR